MDAKDKLLFDALKNRLNMLEEFTDSIYKDLQSIRDSVKVVNNESVGWKEVKEDLEDYRTKVADLQDYVYKP
jgi:hypothetical protein